MDAQGPGAVRPWHQIAQAEFPTLVDQQFELGQIFNLKAVPYGILLDELGQIVKFPFAINVDETKTQDLLRNWLTDPNFKLREDSLATSGHGGSLKVSVLEARARFQLGTTLLQIGKKEEAVAEWRKALSLDPTNWIIHKQIWAVENPDKFYDGAIDYNWQKEQLQTEN